MSARVSQEMETLTRVKTLTGIIDRLVAAGANGSAVAVAAAAPAVTALAGMPREEVARILLGLVAERTGYPAEMLGLDRDVEAELGIDSIKRVETLAGCSSACRPRCRCGSARKWRR